MLIEMSADCSHALLERITRKDVAVGIIGLGYVGLPLAIAFAAAGYRVTGIDVDAQKVAGIRRGESHVADIDGKRVAALVASGQLTATTDYAVLSELDAVSICVPTPLNKTGDPISRHRERSGCHRQAPAPRDGCGAGEHDYPGRRGS